MAVCAFLFFESGYFFFSCIKTLANLLHLFLAGIVSRFQQAFLGLPSAFKLEGERINLFRQFVSLPDLQDERGLALGDQLVALRD